MRLHMSRDKKNSLLPREKNKRRKRFFVSIFSCGEKKISLAKGSKKNSTVLYMMPLSYDSIVEIHIYT